ncbi:MAG: hypothetical protein V7K35_27545 [Nostoc sp.]|uniref:hypothetical protein n=1 Tax=Nostoc sp. TaxID=1180 RepID=UPI002FF7C782
MLLIVRKINHELAIARQIRPLAKVPNTPPQSIGEGRQSVALAGWGSYFRFIQEVYYTTPPTSLLPNPINLKSSQHFIPELDARGFHGYIS